MNKNVKRFDERAEFYESSWKQDKIFKPVHKICIDTIIAHNINPQVIADLGCGTGSLLRQTRTVWNSANLIGVDPSPRMIKIARNMTPNATFCIGYPEDLPFAEKSVDLIFSTMSFHHWNDHAKAVKEINRVLTANGCFILGDVSAPRWLSWLAGDPKYWGVRERLALLETGGFEVKSQEKCLSGLALVTLAQKK